jgi:hypothetical protein
LRPGFQPQFLDFRRGIRIGNLEDHERLTRLLKLALEERYGRPFVTRRWGRGTYWQWIGFHPRTDRESFACAKFFVMLDTEKERFKCGMQVERGAGQPPPDWDWHRLLRSLRPGGALARELDRLIRREEFRIDVAGQSFYRGKYPGAAAVRRAAAGAPRSHWAGFQLYYPMTREEVLASTGPDLVDSMLAVFEEVRAAMNQCLPVTGRIEEDLIRR